MNDFQRHIPVSELADYLEGDLSLLKRVDLESHIAVCPRCANDLAEFEHIIELIRADSLWGAPPSVIDRAVSLFRPRALEASLLSDFRRRVLAVLHFDSLGLAPAFGVRSGKPGARQLLYNVGSEEIDLRIEPTGQMWIVSGQILGEAVTCGTAVLQGTEGTNETILNELSEFVLPPVQGGSYKLIFNLANVDVEIEEIRIGL